MAQRNASRTDDAGISVVIPVRNVERYLAEAIESVLSQTLPPAEIIVADDGSTDGSLQVARGYGHRVQVIEGSPGGIGATRNVGAATAAGEFLAFLDADDYWAPEKLAHQMEAFARQPSLEAVFGQVRQFYSPEMSVTDDERERMSRTVYTGHHAGAMLIRADAFRRVGPFDESLRVGEFLDWHARATDLGLRAHASPLVVMFRRIHDNNTVVRHRASQTDYARILKAALDRRRQRDRVVQSGVGQ